MTLTGRGGKGVRVRERGGQGEEGGREEERRDERDGGREGRGERRVVKYHITRTITGKCR